MVAVASSLERDLQTIDGKVVTSPFIDLRNENPQPDTMFYGTSAIEIVPDVNAVKSTKKVAAIVDHARNSGILHPGVAVGTSGLVHKQFGVAFVDTETPTGPHYLHSRLLVPGPRGYEYVNVPDRVDLQSPDHRTVVSGPCLFTVGGVHGVDTNGTTHYLTVPITLDNINQPLQALHVDPRIQPYEADSVWRLTRFMHNLHTEDGRTTLALNVPRIEYLFYAMDLYRRGIMDERLLFEWYEAVNKRARGIENLMIRRLPPGMNVEFANPLDIVEEHVLAEIRAGHRDTVLQSTLDFLSTNDPTWNYMIQATKPQDFVSIGFASYTIPYLQKAGDASGLLIAVENPEEATIMENVRKHINNIGDKGAVMLGFYPHPNLIMHPGAVKDGQKKMMYFHRPEDVHADLAKVARANQY